MCDPAEVFYLYNGDTEDPAAALMRHLSSEHHVRSFSLFSYSFDGKSFNLTNLIGREKFSSGEAGAGTGNVGSILIPEGHSINWLSYIIDSIHLEEF